MTDYTKIVRALRYCVKARNCEKCAYRINNNSVKCRVQRVEDAADAIEKITAMYEKAEMDATNLTGKLAQAEADVERLNLEIDKRIATEIELSNQVDALQAEVERLKDCNEELREKQTYIDHYGDKWMTSAKDVPTSAYEHGYADGMAEERAKMQKRNAELHAEFQKWVSAAEQAGEPKRGKWIDGDARRVTARCSVCGRLRLGNGAEWANKHVHFCEVCGSRMGDEKA